MKKYKKAWEEQDPDLILECFTKDAIYQESPLAKPYYHHKGIRNFWIRVVVKGQKDIKFNLGECYLDNKRKTGFAEWETYMKIKGKTHHLTGIMLLKMKGDKISYLNEYWNSRK